MITKAELDSALARLAPAERSEFESSVCGAAADHELRRGAGLWIGDAHDAIRVLERERRETIASAYAARRRPCLPPGRRARRGRSARVATNARTRGSRRCSARSPDDPDGESEPPRLAPGRRLARSNRPALAGGGA